MANLSPLRYKNRLYYALIAAGGLVMLMGLYASHMMEVHGHIITGMNNQIVWGMPHVFAIFMIVAASGVLNIASIGSVFGKSAYKGRAPLAGMLSIALLAGGLFVLMLDLGRPDRIIVAATNFNLTSVFAWNIPLYSGLFTFVALYMWTLLERRMNPWIKPVGLIVFTWRIMLTTGTGLIFAFLVARQAYGSAMLPPMFLVLHLGAGGVFCSSVGAVQMERQDTGSGIAESHEKSSWHLLAWHTLSGRGLPSDQPVFFPTCFIRTLHTDYWRHLSVAVLGRLCLAWQCVAAIADLRARLELPSQRAHRIDTHHTRRIRHALCVHHRRAGFPVGHLPGLRSQEQFRRRADQLVSPIPLGIYAGIRWFGHSFSDHYNRCPRIEFRAARQTTCCR
jgi:hypothetical protein